MKEKIKEDYKKSKINLISAQTESEDFQNLQYR